MPKQVTRFEATDGKLFKTNNEATTYNSYLVFKLWYDNNNLHGVSEHDSIPVKWDDLMPWLIRHKAMVIDILDTTDLFDL